MGELAIRGGAPVRRKPYPSWPQGTGAVERNLLQVVASGKWAHSSQLQDIETGPGFVSQLEETVSVLHEVPHAVAVSSGTAALEVLVRSCGIGPGDEVLVPSYTYISTASAILNNAAVPVFCDVDPVTWNIEPALLSEKLTDRTRAVLVVHFAGQP